MKPVLGGVPSSAPLFTLHSLFTAVLTTSDRSIAADMTTATFGSSVVHIRIVMLYICLHISRILAAGYWCTAVGGGTAVGTEY